MISAKIWLWNQVTKSMFETYFIMLLNFLRYSCIASGKWFQRFVLKNNDSTPVLLDIYMDGWNISNTTKTVGLYFTIANLPKSVNWLVQHKFPICLIPKDADIQKVLPFLLQPVAHHLPPKQMIFSKYKGETKNAKIAIARVICDTPGVAEFMGTKNHRSGEFSIVA